MMLLSGLIVKISTRKEYDTLLTILDSHGYRWGGGQFLLGSEHDHYRATDLNLRIDDNKKKVFTGHTATYAGRMIYTVAEFMDIKFPGEVLKIISAENLNRKAIEAIKRLM